MKDGALWALDAGNTSLKVALFGTGAAPRIVHWIPRADWGTIEQAVEDWMRLAGIHRGNEPVVATCARAADTPVIRRVAEQLSRQGGTPFLVDPHGPLPFRYVYTSGAPGGDRLANAMALRTLSPGNWAAAIDFGTATHAEIVDDMGDFRGGIILPGVGLQLESLVGATGGRLPAVQLNPGDPVEAASNSTEGAIRSGILLGQAALVEKFVGLVAGMGGGSTEPVVYLTGGSASLVSPLVRVKHLNEPFLTLIGLAALWRAVSNR